MKEACEAFKSHLEVMRNFAGQDVIECKCLPAHRPGGAKGGKMMAERICDACGKKKPVSGGATCERGHFVCVACKDLGFLGGSRTQCPLCKKPLR